MSGNSRVDDGLMPTASGYDIIKNIEVDGGTDHEMDDRIGYSRLGILV